MTPLPQFTAPKAPKKPARTRGYDSARRSAELVQDALYAAAGKSGKRGHSKLSLTVVDHKNRRRARNNAKSTVVGDLSFKGGMKQALKKQAVKTKSVAQCASRLMSFVYVGNLHPSITPERLESVFEKAGNITRILIRVVRGNATVLPGQAVSPGEVALYATIEFKNDSGAYEALKLNGVEVDGVELVVSQDVFQLPEFYELIEDYHLKKLQPSLSPIKRRWQQLKLLVSSPTEIIDDPANPRPSGKVKRVSLLRTIA